MTFSASLLRVLDALADERVAKAELHRASAAAALALADLHRRSDGKAPTSIVNVSSSAAPQAAKSDKPFISCVHRDTDAWGSDSLASAIPCKHHNVAANETCPDEGFTEEEQNPALSMTVLAQLDEEKAAFAAALKDGPVEAPDASIGGITFYEPRPEAASDSVTAPLP